MLPILQVGPLAIQLPGLLLLLGFWLGTLSAERAARASRISTTLVSNMIFYSLIGGILGARLGYVLQFLDLYLEAPLGIIALNPNTLSLREGLVAGGIVAIVFAQRKGLPFWQTLDVLAPGVAVFMLIVGFSHLASGDAFGVESDVPWAIDLWGAQRHPTQVYEILASGVVLFIVYRLQTVKRIDGFIILSYLVLAGVSRFVIEAFRGDSVIIFDSLRAAQLLSFLIVLVALLALHFRARSISYQN